MIVVNSSTRQFNIPGADLVFGVTADASAVIKEFQCPRYVGNNLDLTSCFIRMNYRNANGEVDSYLVSDVTVDGDNIVFGWELSPRVTMYKGNVSFVMCVVGPDTKVAWHTTLGRGQVLEGLEPEWESVMDETVDVVAQLIAMVEAQTKAVVDKGAEWVRNVQSEGTDQIIAVQTAARESREAAVAEIEAKGASTLATIPGEYTATVNAVQSAANAIRKKVSGEVIRVDDVSPMEHYPEIKVSGKNLFNIGALETMPESYTTRISAVDTENNTFTITTADTHTGNGYCGLTNAEGNYVTTLRDLCPQMEAGKTYTLSGNTGTETKTLYLRGVNTSWVFGKSMMITEEHLDAKVAMYGLNSAGGEGTGDCVISNLQIEEGAVVTEYTPYIDPTTVTVRRCGKNILSYPYDGTCFDNGITFTDNGDGSITLNGTNNGESNSVFYITKDNYLPFPAGSYTGYLGATGVSLMGVVKGGGYKTLHSSFKLSETIEMRSIYLQVAKGSTVTFDNVKVYPFVEVGTTTVTYEPYIGETQIPSSDGTVSGLTAVSPTMTLMTDKAGANIECEYSRDTNAVIAEILEKITALGG